MYEVDRNPAPTHLPKRGFFYISRTIVSDRLAFDKGVSLHTLGSEIAKSARPGFELTTYGSQANALTIGHLTPLALLMFILGTTVTFLTQYNIYIPPQLLALNLRYLYFVAAMLDLSY